MIWDEPRVDFIFKQVFLRKAIGFLPILLLLQHKVLCPLTGELATFYNIMDANGSFAFQGGLR